MDTYSKRKKQNNNADIEKVEIFSLKEYLSKCLQYWRWFVISLVVFLGLGMMYVLRMQPVYNRYTDVLIKDQDMGGSSDIASAFSSMGLISSNTNVNNELISLTSPAVMYEVVKRLNLNMTYIEKGFPHGWTLYGSSQPWIISLPDMDPQRGCSFRIRFNEKGQMELFKFKTRIKKQKLSFDDIVVVPKGSNSVKTPLGRIVINDNPAFAGVIDKEKTIMVGRTGMQATVEIYSAKLKGDLLSKDAEVIDLSIKDVNTERADDILRTVVAVYNENWVEDKNRLAIATSSFIDERLKGIEAELGVVDNDISTYKSNNLTPDLQATAQIYLEQNADREKEILETSNELAMTGYIQEYLADPTHRNSVIPMNTGIGNVQLESQISSYNSLLLSRNNLASNSSDNNPLVADYDNQLKGLREAIVRAVSAQRSQLTAALRNLQRSQSSTQGSLATAPTQAKYLLSVERQQKVKESLYLYLLQKREENELTQTFTAYNTRVITPPTGPINPVSPKTKMIMALMLIIGLGLPGTFIYIIVSNDNKIHSRRDLENLSMPFVGEIPNVGKNSKVKKLLRSRKKNKQLLERPLFVVEEGKRDVINEAFRVVRSNLSLMLGKETGCQVVMFTSFNPGSGKSFISYNLASAFILKGKKILLIDGDLRHGSTSNFVNKPKKGLSNYLTSASDDWHSLVVKGHGPTSPDVLPIGAMPPNPAELLENGRLGKIINDARSEYDVIFIDCPPVDIVVDTQIIEQYVDRTIFVVRANLLERSALTEIEELYNEKRYKQMSILLNGTDTANSRYHTYGNYQSLEADRG